MHLEHRNVHDKRARSFNSPRPALLGRGLFEAGLLPIAKLTEAVTGVISAITLLIFSSHFSRTAITDVHQNRCDHPPTTHHREVRPSPETDAFPAPNLSPLFDNLRRLAGVSGAGARCRNPERSGCFADAKRPRSRRILTTPIKSPPASKCTPNRKIQC